MEGSRHDDLRRQLEEYEAENRGLREQLEETESEIDRLRRENEELRRELKAAGRETRRGRRKPKADPKGPGRKAGQGPFTFRKAPAAAGASSGPPIEVPVTGRSGRSGARAAGQVICGKLPGQHVKMTHIAGAAFALLIAARAEPIHPRVTISPLTARFFSAAAPNGAFSATVNSPVVFTQRFTAINFNPPASTIPCTNSISTGVDTRPFTNVIRNRDGSCSTVAAKGNGRQAGVEELESFDATFTGSFTVSAPGRVPFHFYSDDGWILGIGRHGALQPIPVTGPMIAAPAVTPFAHFRVMGADNTAHGPQPSDLVVDFPAAGTYEFELDYSECCGGGLALTLTAGEAPIEAEMPGISPLLGLGTLAVTAIIALRWRARNQQRKQKEDVTRSGFAMNVAGNVLGGEYGGYRIEIRSRADLN